MDQNAKSQAIEQIKKAQNVLVTVSDNPSVDQLAAAIGFTLLLNKLNKHATAVFSGQVPSTIEFLKPEETLEDNTDSLRDFIISLDKNKADKLRYKVEDEVVRIYVTPYRTSITEKDLTFSQGDYNVDVVIALGVYNQDQLDKAIQDHGRILHDAAIVSVIAGTDAGDIGGINWNDKNASSLCEMLMGISESLKPGVIDEQIATALLTGIVAETDRFSNEKTTPKAMTMSAQLMSAGANQQLISESLTPEPDAPAEPDKPADYEENSGPSLADLQVEQEPQESEEEVGVLNLHHGQEQEPPEPVEQEPEVEDHHIGIDDDTGKFANAEQLREAVAEVQSKGSFKGKTIAPPTEDYQPGGTLPDLSGQPSYTPGRVTNAPISALDEGGYQPEQPLQQEQTDGWQDQQSVQGEPNFDSGQSNVDQGDQQYNMPPPEIPVVPMEQGEPYIRPDELPKEHGEDSLSDEEAQELLRQQEEHNTEIPEIKLESSNREFLDHPPSTDPGDEDHSEEEEKPSIEYGPDKYSHYLTEPPKDEPKLNSLDGVKPDEYVDPLANIPSAGPMADGTTPDKPKEDPWLSTQHDAESPRATEVPETRHPRLSDDGVERYKNKPLGPAVDDDDTLDEIEHHVEEAAGSVHGKKEQEARQAVQNVMDSIGQQENPLQYLELDSDPTKKADESSNPYSGDNDSPPPAPPPLMPPAF